MTRKLVRTTMNLFEDQVAYGKRVPGGLSKFIRTAIDNEVEANTFINQAKKAALDVISDSLDECTPATLCDIAIKQGFMVTYPLVEKYLEEKKMR